MQYCPYKYQSRATDFIINHNICALMLDSGRGKKVITLTALEQLVTNYFSVKKVLILTSKTSAKNRWIAEIEKWTHLKSITYSLVLGSKKDKLTALMKNATIYITNKESLLWLEQNNLLNFDTLVIDGLYDFRNEHTQRFKIICDKHFYFKRIIALTSAPSYNTLQFMWGQMYILDKGNRLGKTKAGFYERYFFRRKTSYSKKSYKEPKNGAYEAITKAISDICWIGSQNDYEDVPSCVYRDIYIRLTPTEYSKYQWIENELQQPYKDVTTPNDKMSFSNIIKLMQLANGTICDDADQPYTLHKQKLDALAELIKEISEKNILIAYWFPQDKWSIKNRFPDVKSIETKQDIADWNAKKIPLALINPATFNKEISLCNGGNTLIWYSLTWSEELYHNMNRCIYDMTQRNNLVIIHILSKDTIDEIIIKTLFASEQRHNNFFQQIYRIKEEYYGTDISINGTNFIK